MSSQQQTFDGRVLFVPDHLTKEQLGQTRIRKSREYYCEDCEHRVTLSSDGEREYGHGKDDGDICEHRIPRGDN